jgi:hypothetical protein
MTTFTAQSHVAFGDWWTPTNHNTMIDNIAAFWTAAVQYSIPYWSDTDEVGALTLEIGQVVMGTGAAPAAAYPPGQRLAALAALPPLSGVAAAALEYGESSGAAVDGLKPILPMLSFAEATDNARLWVDELRGAPGTMTLKVRYKMGSANTSKDVKFLAHIAAVSDGDASVSAKVFDTANNVTVSVPDAADVDDETTITLTNDDSIAKGDWFCLSLKRDTSVADNATGVCRVLSVELQYG